ncbi:MAG: ABC transporter ATP-binding protein [Candidatus Tectomicrobia bacterium]|nr:ABC transporter ATP-binding protein [Candidatus Tectomicrobia bacterium]
MIEIRGLHKVYPSRSASVVALEDVSFAVREREFLSIVGPSGCGKSTILRLILGLLPKTQGEILFKGAPIAGTQFGMGMVYQAPTLLPWRTVTENVLFPLEMHGRKVAPFRRRAQELIRSVGLQGFEDKYPHELSGGMQQRTALCRALIEDPAVLLMDEPFAALDALTRERLNLEMLRIWTETQKTVVFVTHSVEEAVFLSDRIVVMTPRPGRVASTVDIELERPRTLETKNRPRFVDHVSDIKSRLMQFVA